MIHVQTGNMLDVVIEGKSIGLSADDTEKQARDLLRDLQRRGFLDDDIFENPNFDDSFVVSLVATALRSEKSRDSGK